MVVPRTNAGPGLVLIKRGGGHAQWDMVEKCYKRRSLGPPQAHMTDVSTVHDTMTEA